MRIICEKSDLLKSNNIAIRAVPVRTTMPILECILIEAKNGMIRLTGNNLNLGIDTYIEGTILEDKCKAVNYWFVYFILQTGQEKYSRYR